MNEIIEQYVSNVKKELYHLVHAEDYISDLRINLEEYVRQFPDSTYSDLVEQFGTPETVAKEFIDIKKPNNPKERSKHRFRTRLFVILTIIIIMFLICFIAALSGSRQAYYDDTTIIIEETDVPEK